MHLQLGFIVANEVEFFYMVSNGMNHFPSHKSKLTLVQVEVAYTTTNHFVVVYATTSCFYQVPQKTFASIVAKMVDLDISHKSMSCNG